MRHLARLALAVLGVLCGASSPASALLPPPDDRLLVRTARLRVARRGRVQVDAVFAPQGWTEVRDVTSVRVGEVELLREGTTHAETRAPTWEMGGRWVLRERTRHRRLRIVVDLGRGKFTADVEGVDLRPLAAGSAGAVTVSVAAAPSTRTATLGFRTRGGTWTFRGARDAASPSDGPQPWRLLRDPNGGWNGLPGVPVVARTARRFRRVLGGFSLNYFGDEPAVDFSQEMVVAVFVGGSSDSCSALTAQVRDVERAGDNVTLTIETRSWHATPLPPACGQSMSSTSIFVAVPRAPGRVRVVQVRAQDS